MKKGQIRKEMLEKRLQMTNAQRIDWSNLIARRFLESNLYQNAAHICIYQAFRGEVICDTIREQAFIDGKKVYTPVTNIQNKEIVFYQIHSDTQYRKGAYDIDEPILEKNATTLMESALILMPGLAMDRKKHRIGYGGGYYDRYLANHTEHTTVALCFSFQVLDFDIIGDIFDIAPDYILTEKELF